MKSRAGHADWGFGFIAFYQAALAVSQAIPPRITIGSFLREHGRTDEALYHSEAYLRVSSSIPHAHHMRGHELRRAGRIEDAVEEFRKRTSWRLPTIVPSTFLQSTTGTALIISASCDVLSVAGTNENRRATAA